MSIQEAQKIPNFGLQGEPRAPIIQQLGVAVVPRTITGYRGSEVVGIVMERRLKAAELLRSDNAGNKDRFFRDYAVEGILQRDRYDGTQSHAFVYEGFIPQVADSLGISGNSLRGALRVARIDLALNPLLAEPSFNHGLKDAIVHYLDEFSPRKNKGGRPSPTIDLSARWRKGTVSDFYRLILRDYPHLVLTLGPFEVEAFRTGYVNRIKRGSHLTSFDRRILEAQAQNTDQALIKEIKDKLGIHVAQEALRYYRSALYGELGARASEATEVSGN